MKIIYLWKKYKKAKILTKLNKREIIIFRKLLIFYKIKNKYKLNSHQKILQL